MSMTSPMDIEQGIAQRFLAMSDLYSARPAVCEDGVLTYGELRERMFGFAARQLASGACAGDRIVMYHQSAADMAAEILATLYNGCIYVPVAPMSGADPIISVIREVQPRMVCTDSGNRLLAECAEQCGVRLVKETVAPKSTGPSGLGVGGPDSPASILYTSGSTGRRKGVLQNQRNIMYHVRLLTERFAITVSDVHSLLSSFIFDASTTDLYCAILNGALLAPVDVRRKGMDRTLDALMDNAVSIVHGTPSLLRNLCAVACGRRIRAARLVIIGGETLFGHDLERLASVLPDECKVVNGYGATETSGFVALYEARKAELLPGKVVPIGRAPDGVSISLRANRGGVSEHGEVCITSRHVALGYWGQEGEEPHRFSVSTELPDCRIYATGDLGYWSEAGDLVLCGRVDRQVKLRGFRTDLDEIEGVFLSYTGITHAVALVREDGSRLEVFLCCACGRLREVAQLQTYLRKRLPGYLLPVAMFYLDPVPLTATGKIDRLAVSRLDRAQLAPVEEPRAAINTGASMLEVVTQTCRRVLGLRRAAAADRFFDLGGDSVTMAQLHAELEGLLGLNVPLSRYYEFATLGELAAFLQQQGDQHRPDSRESGAFALGPPSMQGSNRVVWDA